VSFLELNKNQRCSWHTHQTKFNTFYCLRGVFYVKNDFGTTEIAEGQIFTTIPGEWHEFQTHEHGALVIEVMYVEYNSEDIQREELGGPLWPEEIEHAQSTPDGDREVSFEDIQKSMGLELLQSDEL